MELGVGGVGMLPTSSVVNSMPAALAYSACLLLVYVIARHDYTKSGATKGSKRAAEALRAEAQNTRMEQIKVPFGRL